MAEGLILEFEGIGEAEYRAVNAALGIGIEPRDHELQFVRTVFLG
jgi:hypothetical protein